MKKAYFIFLFLLSVVSYPQIRRIDHNDTWAKNAQGQMYLLSSAVDTILVNPDWHGLQKDLYASPLFTFAADTIGFLPTIGYWSPLIKCISDGQTGSGSDPQTFIYLLRKCNIPFSQAQKDQLNAILTKNYFAVQL